MASGGAHLSKEFFELVKSIGESRSKQEEDKIILNEVSSLKVKMAARDVPAKKMKEYLMRMIYVEMLGHDASFGHIHAVKMANSTNILEKRMGYLAVCLTLNPDHQFMLLLINTMQKDMRSDNFLEVSMALNVVCKLVSPETVPALLPLTVKLLDHKEGLVKKKAVMALHRYHALQPESTASLNANIRKALCDSNISVMYASLHLLHDLAIEKPAAYKDLVPDFVSILKQVIEHRLPRDYDYHRMPAPWIQLKLLNILAVLGASDKNASEQMYDVLHEVMKRADVGINVGYAIVYECVRTITSIYPSQALIEDAALSVSRFITSENHNLKYLGVTSLASIVQIDPKYAAEHQLVVIDCLEDPDDTLKRKTLDLLYSMTNPQNVTVVVDKLIGFLNAATDAFMRQDLLSRIVALAEKYAPSNDWYIQAMNNMMELAGDQCKPEYANNLMKLIIDNASGMAGEEDIREFAVDTYIHLLNSRRSLPELLVQVSAWVIGEYGHCSHQTDSHTQLQALQAALERAAPDQAITKGWIISAMLKIVARIGSVPSEIMDLVVKYQNSQQVDLQQRAHEFIELTKAPQLALTVLPPDQAAQDFQVDETLSFLDGYVDAALQAGAKPYVPRTDFLMGDRKDDHSLKTAAYAPAQIGGQHGHGPPMGAPHGGAPAGPYGGHADPNAPQNFFGQNGAPGFDPAGQSATGLQVKERKWGPKGFNDPHQAPQQQQQQQQQPPQNMPYGGPPGSQQGPPQQQQQGFGGPQPHDQHFNGPPGSHGPSHGAPHGNDFGPPQPQQAPPQPRVRPPPQLSEREKLASSLFGGAPAATGVRPQGSFGRPPVAASQSFGRPAPGPAPGQHPQHPQHPGQHPGQHVQQQPQPPKQIDLLGGLLNEAPAPVVASPPNRAAAGSPLDLLGGASSPRNDTSLDFLASGNGLGPLTGLAAASPLIQQQLTPFPKGSQSDIIVNQDANISISYQKNFSADSTIVAIYITSKNGQPIERVQTQLTAPAGFEVKFSGEPAFTTRPGQGPTAQVVVFSGPIPVTPVGVILVHLSVRELAFLNTPTIQINGQLGYQGLPGAPLAYSIPVDLTDILRPAPMTTQQYGGFWKQYADEAKASVRPSNVHSSPEYQSKVTNEFRIHHVQTIGQENIAAGRVITPPGHPAVANMLVFVHGKVIPGTGVDLIVHSKSAPLSQALARTVQNCLKQ